MRLSVRRGLPHPYASHPRLDLFVGSLSPHKMADIGCTICHEGQGSATAFKWASHSPNDPREANKWKQDHGWFDNHHWIFPMYPRAVRRKHVFEVPSRRDRVGAQRAVSQPPAPKLVEGFRTIQQVGCFGCHEINGFEGRAAHRAGSRTEPNYSAAAQAIAAGGGLNDQQLGWAEDVVAGAGQRRGPPFVDRVAKEPAGNLARPAGRDQETAGSVGRRRNAREDGKVGPSLRHVAAKLDFGFLYSWIRKPSDFRPTTKMPQFFGLTEHLDTKSLDESHRFEPIEIRGISEYLLGKSQPFEYTARPKSVSVEASAERGKQAFQVRCLACHQHADFPTAKMTQGPDLSRLGASCAQRTTRTAVAGSTLGSQSEQISPAHADAQSIA